MVWVSSAFEPSLNGWQNKSNIPFRGGGFFHAPSFDKIMPCSIRKSCICYLNKDACSDLGKLKINPSKTKKQQKYLIFS